MKTQEQTTHAKATEQLGKRDRRKIGNNTYLERRTDGSIAVKLHETDVLTFHADGRTVYDSGGWQTVTTKQRMNEHGPLSIYSDRGVWYAGTSGAWSERDSAVAYADGLTLHADGTITRQDADPKAQQKARKAVEKYADAFIAALEAGNVAAPGAGDCFYCGMVTAKNQTPLGEAVKDRSHIELHMEEQYFVPSLLANACKAGSVAPAAWWYLGSFWDADADDGKRQTARRAAGGIGRTQVRKALIKYVRRQLGQAA